MRNASIAFVIYIKEHNHKLEYVACNSKHPEAQMDILPLVERIGENPTGALFGLITGVIFGIAAQRSRFCLRAATIEFASGRMGPSMTVWLLTFSTALFWVQGANLLDRKSVV